MKKVDRLNRHDWDEKETIMKHLFKATKLGWDEEKEGIWFDSDHYTKEEAESEIKPYDGITQDGFPYVGYEYDGQRYHDVTYLGEFEDDNMPTNDAELIDIRLAQLGL